MRFSSLLVAVVMSAFSMTVMAREELETSYSFAGKNYEISYKLQEEKQILSLYGTVLSGLVEDLKGFKRVKKLIRPDIDIEIILHSGGGYQREFNSMASAIKKACDSNVSNCRITTRVRKWDRCASACIPFFMIGDERIASEYARFGFHQAAVIPGLIKIPNFAQRDLRNNGVDSSWLATNRQLFASLSITWLYPSELDGSNIVTEMQKEESRW